MAAAVNPVTNMVYVANMGLADPTGNVTVINGATNATTTVTDPNAALPIAIAVNPKTNMIYVANLGAVDTTGNVTVINGATNATTTVTDPNATSPVAIAVNPATNKIYVANMNTFNVTVINGATNVTTTVTDPNAVSPVALAVNPATNTIYVANIDSSNVTVINGATNAVTATITVGAVPVAIAVNPVTNTIYVANNTSSNVTVINGATNATTTVGAGTTPVAVAVNPLTNIIYVANQDGQNVTVINGATNATSAVAAGTDIQGIAVNPVTNTIYVANGGSNNVTVIDGSTDASVSVAVGNLPLIFAVNPVTNTIYCADGSFPKVWVINGATNASSSIPVAFNILGPHALAVNPATNTIYASGYITGGGGSNGTVAVINGATNTVTTYIAVGNNPKNLAVNPVTNTIYVINYASFTLSVINGATNTVTATIPLPDTESSGVAVNPVTNTVYVTEYTLGTLTVINGATNTVTANINVGNNPNLGLVDTERNSIYLFSGTDTTATVVDGATNAVTATLNLPFNLDQVAFDPLTGTILGASSSGTWSETLAAISDTTNTVSSVTVGTTCGATVVNPTTNKIYVVRPSGLMTVNVLSGITNTVIRSAPAGSFPYQIAVNPVTNTIYIGSEYEVDTVTAISEQAVQSSPLSASITPLAGNTTASTTPTFTFTAQSSFSPTAPHPLGVFFQVDTWQGPWTQATSSGSSWSGTVPTLQPGFHFLYAFADDGQDATSTQSGSPLVSNIAAYGFLVAPHTVTDATVTLTPSSLNQTYTGSPLAVAETTSPSGLAVSCTYTGTGSTTYGPSSTAPTVSGTYGVTVTVSDPNYQGSTTGTLTINQAAATVSLASASLNQAYTGSPLAVAATTTPSGLTVTFTYTGTGGTTYGPSSTAPKVAGTYGVTATISDTNYQGSTTGTLTIAQAIATVTLTPSSLDQTYTGSPLAATATTSPPGLTVSFTYTGSGSTTYPVSATAPTAVGTYTVGAVINDSNYTGSSTGTLTVAAALPGVPTGVSAVGGNGQATVSFTAPSITGGASLSGYTVTATPTSGPTITATGTSSPITVAGLTNGMTYTFTIVATNSAGTGSSSQASAAVTLPLAYLNNLSARAFVNNGGGILIAGFGTAGSGTKNLLLRGVGPGMYNTFQIPGYLPSVQLAFYDGETVAKLIACNTCWSNSPATGDSPVCAEVNCATPTLMATVGAFAFAAGSLDAALAVSVPAGSFTSQVIGQGTSPTGVALAEVYDADVGIPSATLINLSARVQVGTGFNVLIGGFSITGNTTEKVLIRGVGPGLTSTFQLSGTLAQPLLQLYDSENPAELIAQNSGWNTTPTIGNSPVVAIVAAATASDMNTVGAFSLVQGSADAAMVVTLPPGQYTAELSGVGGTTGIGLVEVYAMP